MSKNETFPINASNWGFRKLNDIGNVLLHEMKNRNTVKKCYLQ